MITEAGHFALIVAFMVAIAQGVVPLVGAQVGNARWRDTAVPLATAQFVLLLISFAALTHAYVVSDFSVLNVASNSHTDKPMLYKISGVWGNHEGSMLLWVLILALFGQLVGVFGKNIPPGLKSRTLAIQSLVAVGFLAFILFTSNPFERLFPPPANGQSLNPLLQDPGLAFHPPFLYLGYVGFSIVYSFAIAALIEGKVDAAWARWVRPWTLVAWVSLTVGIVLGSWWAYYELGWGGWWFWDPVENASFMPWLAGTALLHSAIVVEKRDTLKAWTIFLAIVAFSLSLLGTFLVRSGVLTSVHAFAVDPSRGVFILALLIIAIGGSFALFAWRGPQMQGGGLFKPVSRESALLLNNWFLTTATLVVLLGTLYPLFIDAIGAGKVSVGAPFFNKVFIPIMAPMIVIMALGPFMSWKRADLPGVLGRLKFAYAVTAAAVLYIWWLMGGESVFALVGIGIGMFLALGTIIEFAERVKIHKIQGLWQRIGRQPRSTWGMTIAHFGMAIGIFGMVGAGAWPEERIQVMQPGESIEISGYTYTFEGARNVRGPNYNALRGRFDIADSDGDHIVSLFPEKRTYDTGGQPTTEAGIYSLFWGDVYAVVGDPTGGGAFVTRLYFNPLVSWMWFGTALLTLGGLISLSDRRFRVGAPKRNLAATAPGKSGSAVPAE